MTHKREGRPAESPLHFFRQRAMSTHTSPPSVDTLARQLHVFKILVVALILALLGGAGYYLYEKHLGQPVTIVIAGKPVATVRNMAAANQILAAAERAKVGAAFDNEAPILLHLPQFQRAPADSPVDADAIARQKLTHVLNPRVHAFVIVVKGKPSLGLPSADEAQRTLELVKQHFAQMPPQAQVLGDPEIVEKVAIAPKVIGTALARQTAEDAAPYFWTPPHTRTYVVKSGDTGFKIALRNHLSFADFLTANSGHDLNKLKPGDVVNVQRMPLLLTVRVQKQFTRDEPIVAHAPPDQAGLQRVTYVVTYLNGQETKRDVANSAMLEKPATRMEL